MKDAFQTLRPYLWRYRRGFSLGMGALMLKDLLGTLMPLLMRWGIDSLNRGFRIEAVVWFAAALVAVSALKGVFQYWMRVILIGISRDVEYDLRNDLFGNLVGLS